MDYEKLFDDIAADIIKDKSLKEPAPDDLTKNKPEKTKKNVNSATTKAKNHKSAGPGEKDQQKNKSRSINGYSKKGCKLGRPTLGNNTRKKIIQEIKREKNADTFLLVENSPPDVVQNNDLYIECLNETIQAVKLQFFAENPDLIKKHPSIWFRFLCNTIKKNIPRIDFNNFDLLSSMWDIYADLCMDIGINRTIQNFEIFTGFSYDLTEKLQKSSSPTAILLTKKIYAQCKHDIVGGLSSSFGSSPNQMFIAKAVYGLTENTVVTHVSRSDNDISINDLPLFIENKSENN